MSCPNYEPPKIHSVRIIRGNRWTLYTRFRIKGDPAFDWTGLTAEFRVRPSRSPGSPVLFVLTPSVFVSRGAAGVLIDIPGASTGGLPDFFSGDLLLSRVVPAFGPHAAVQIDFAVEPSA